MTASIYGEVVLRAVPADWFTFEEMVGEQVYWDVPAYISHYESIIDLGRIVD